MATARYTEAVGRRKTATARVRITPAKNTTMEVNGMDAKDYFPLNIMMKTAYEPLALLGATYLVTARVSGGGWGGGKKGKKPNPSGWESPAQ